MRLGQILPGVLLLGAVAMAQDGSLVLNREGRTISLEPYAPNIVRVTISTDKAAASGAPGYGISAQPSAQGWTHERDSEGDDIFRSAQMVVRVSPENPPRETLPQTMPLDALNLQLRAPYFGGGGGHRPPNDALSVTTPAARSCSHAQLGLGAGKRRGRRGRRRRQRLSGHGHIRRTARRARLRTRPAAERLDGPARSPDPLLA